MKERAEPEKEDDRKDERAEEDVVMIGEVGNDDRDCSFCIRCTIEDARPHFSYHRHM